MGGHPQVCHSGGVLRGPREPTAPVAVPRQLLGHVACPQQPQHGADVSECRGSGDARLARVGVATAESPSGKPGEDERRSACELSTCGIPAAMEDNK